MHEKLISFDLYADFGFLKKPDVNDGLVMGYNMLHKPALLGILGAIIGLRGYERKGQLPEYYKTLQKVQVGIEPINFSPGSLRHEQGNFQKTALTYTNTVGYANADGNLIITEQTLISPAYRCYILLDLSNETQEVLCKRIRNGEAAYLPYIGKNEFSAWWNEVREYEHSPFNPSEHEFRIQSVFIRNYPMSKHKVQPKFSPSTRTVVNASSFVYFERLPIGFNEQLYQYELAEFMYSDWFWKQDTSVENLYSITQSGNNFVIQLF